MQEQRLLIHGAGLAGLAANQSISLLVARAHIEVFHFDKHFTDGVSVSLGIGRKKGLIVGALRDPAQNQLDRNARAFDERR